MTFKEKRLAENAAWVVDAYFSPDGRGALAIENLGGNSRRASLNGQPHAGYEEINSVEFSQDGNRVAYVGRKGNIRNLIVDGESWGAFDEILHLGFSGDGRTLEYFTKRDGIWERYRDRTKIAAYTHVRGGRYGGPNAWHFRAERDGKHLAVIDGRDTEAFDVLYGPYHGPNNTLIYGARQDGKSFYQLPDRRSPEYDDLRRPAWSPDGKTLAYPACRDKQWFLVVNGKEGKTYEDVDLPTFSDDGKQLAWLAQVESRWCVVVDGRNGPGFESIGDLVHLGKPGFVYRVNRGDRVRVVVGDREGEAFERITRPEMTRDGEPCYIGTTDRTSWIVEGDWKSEAYDGIRPIKAGDPGPVAGYEARKGDTSYLIRDRRIVHECDQLQRVKATPAGTLVFVSVRNGKSRFGWNDKKGPDFDEILDPVLSPDQSSAAYPARDGEDWFLVWGESRSGPIGRVWKPSFSRDGRQVGFGALVDGELWWKVLS